MWRQRLAKVGSAVALAAGMYIGAMYLAQDALIFMKPQYSRYDEEDVASFMSQDIVGGRQLLQISLTQKDNESFLSPISVNSGPKTSERFAYLLTPDPNYEKELKSQLKRKESEDGEAKEQKSQNLKLWVFFGGNAQTALSWVYILHKHLYLASKGGKTSITQREAYLLIDYPGYGKNGGEPGRQSMSQDAMKAIERAVGHLQKGYPSLISHGKNNYVEVGLFGHSIGCAAALDVAATEEMKRIIDPSPTYEITQIILSAPFTSLLEMARKIVGRVPLLSMLLKHDFDNIASLNVFANNRLVRESAPAVRLDIIHGTRDGICPHSMGVELSEQAQKLAHEAGTRISSGFTSIEGGDHNEILFGYWDLYMTKMHSML